MFLVMFLGRKKMVKITIDLSELEIEMLMHCIDAALDTEHVKKESEIRIKEIKDQLSKYLSNCP